MSTSEKTGKMLATKNWNLELFGRGHLSCDDLVVRLERKTAALFAFLALEGATSRSKLAGLLWADSTEESARSSLRQRLYRLRTSVGKDLIVSDEPLRLEPSLAIDAVRFESLIFTSEYGKALELEGELLAGNDYDDCPDLNDWVLAARERLESGRREALSSEANLLEAAGEYQKALGRSQQLLARDPILEDTHRRVMRLHYLAGDRPAALRAFEQCQTILKTQLGIEPLLETRNLATLIAGGDPLPQITLASRISIPIQILRPPVLAGRNHEWAQLETAWEAKNSIIVRGEPGVGKTRLMLDFAASKGTYAMLEGRPGDVGVPYASAARGLKRVLEQHTNLELVTWVRQELSRILPDLEADAPSAIGSDTEKLRFFSAILEPFNNLKVQAIVADDLQFMDSASLELWQYLKTQLTPNVQTFSGYRTGELEASLEASLLQETILIDLKPLETEGLNALLHGLALPGITELAASLEQYTGGNPMYVLETLKSLLETGGITRGLPQHFPPPHKIGALIRHRLERLSPSALRLARVAAVAETDFCSELATQILEIKSFDVAELLTELERAQVLVGERFAHDLIFEATLEGVPNTIKIFLNRRIAEHLETVNAAPARIAQHWLAASDFDRAVPAMINAAEAAQRMVRDDEAIDLLERAIALPVVVEQRHLAQAMLGGIYVLKNRFEDAERSLNSLLEVVSDAEAHWLTLDHLCFLHTRKGSLETAQRHGEQALELATLHGVASRLVETRYKLGVIAHYTGENQRAVELILPAVKSGREQPANVNFLHALGGLAQSLHELGRTNEALLYEDEMMRHAKTMGADHVIANHLGNILYRDFLSGDASQALSNAQSFLSDLEGRGSDVDVCPLRNNMAAIYARLERLDEAIGHYTTLTLGANIEYHLAAWANLAILHTQQAQPETARHALTRALELALDNEYPTPRFALIRAVYTLGTPEQLAQVQPYLDALNVDALPASYRTELEELISAKL